MLLGAILPVHSNYSSAPGFDELTPRNPFSFGRRPVLPAAPSPVFSPATSCSSSDMTRPNQVEADKPCGLFLYQASPQFQVFPYPDHRKSPNRLHYQCHSSLKLPAEANRTTCSVSHPSSENEIRPSPKALPPPV